MKYLLLIVFMLVSPSFAKEGFHVKGHKEDVPQHSPLGFLNASGLFQVGRDDVIVQKVKEGGIAAEGGLKVGDVIIAANSKRFEKATDLVDDGGKGPREGIGMAMESSLSTKDKTLTLTIMRNNKKLDLKLLLKGYSPFSATYPFNCARSDKMLDDICSYILTNQKPGGGFGGKAIQTSTAALGLLSTGNLKYKMAIQKAAYALLTKKIQNEKFPTWAYIYSSTFLCEYFLATGDQKVLPRIKEISDKLALEGTSEKGRHSHGMRTKAGYGGSGLNIISAHVLLVWNLAKRCGIKIHDVPYQATLKHLKKCTKKTGGTGYRQAAGMGDAAARTGLFALALYLSGEEPELLKIQGDYLARHTKRMRECHTNALFGMMWGSAALACVNPEGYRTHMDYWRWYMNMGDTPKGHSLARYYIGGKKNNGGDGYLKYDKYNHYALSMFLGISKKNLFVHGNTKKNWYKTTSKN